MPGPSTRHTAIICPLAFEARALGRRLRLPRPGIALHTSGPGPAGVRSAVQRLAQQHAPPEGLLVILAGLAGGLADVATVPRIGAVIAADGRRWDVPFPPAAATPPVTLLGLDAPLLTPAQKQEWQRRSGAALVDTESHALAQACTDLRMTWTVVRGVSDPWDEPLPPQVARWITSRGTLRPGRAALDVLRSPRLVPTLRRLGRRSAACLPGVAQRIEELVRAWCGQGSERA